MRYHRIMAAGLLTLLATAGLAQPSGSAASGADATCPQPSPPPSQSLRPPPVGPKPAMPGCVDPRTMVARCKPAVIAGFNAQVSRYNQAIAARGQAGARYVEALNAWTRDVSAYANCELTRMNAETPAD